MHIDAPLAAQINVISLQHDFSIELVLHSINVAYIAARIGREMELPEEDINNLYFLSIMHDIGKSKIPESILYKKGKLSEYEWSMMRMHPIYSESIYLQSVGNRSNTHDHAKVIRHHHEYYNGKGYPDGLKGEDIPLLSRIITIADIFEAITSPRIYRPTRICNPFTEMDKEVGIITDPKVYEYAFPVLDKYYNSDVMLNY